MITKPNYIDITSTTGELLPHVEQLHVEGDIDAIIVRGGLARLSPADRAFVQIGIPAGWGYENREYGERLLSLLVPDLSEVRSFYAEVADSAMADYGLAKHLGVLMVDAVREGGLGASTHVDEVIGGYNEGEETIRAISSLSIGCGSDPARFLSKRLSSFNRLEDIIHRFLSEYASHPAIADIKRESYIGQAGWALEQSPGDIVIFPQFDRPAVHQVRAGTNRHAVVYSTFITSTYAAYRGSDQYCKTLPLSAVA